MKEPELMRRIMLAVSKLPGAKIFRHNVGEAWAGKGDYDSKSRSCYVTDAYRIKYGLVVGGSDLIGWTTVTVTEDMVGQKHALFTALEIKTKTGRASKEQMNFIEQLTNAGGLAGIARSEDDAKGIIQSGTNTR